MDDIAGVISELGLRAKNIAEPRSIEEVSMMTWSKWRAKMLVVFAVLAVGCVLMSACAAAPLPTPTPQASDRASFQVPDDPPDTCLVTPPPGPPFTPPPPYSPQAPAGYAWYGTQSLWTAIPDTGVWYGLPQHPGGYTQKLAWWRKGYDWRAEPQPKLTVSGRRLDAPAPPFKFSDATNAFAEDIGSAMLIGVDIPTLGCWEVTGQYVGRELSYVVWVAP
jgi:hypothetical protein